MRPIAHFIEGKGIIFCISWLRSACHMEVTLAARVSLPSSSLLPQTHTFTLKRSPEIKWRY